MTRLACLALILIACGRGGGDGGTQGGPEPWPEAAPRDGGTAPRVDAASLEALPVDGGTAGFGSGPPGSGGIVSPMAVASPSCPDPVVGVWIAKTYAEASSRWHEHRLSITRGPDGELSAIQTTRLWDGGPDDAIPPVCPTGGLNQGITTLQDDVRFVDGILTVTGVAILDRVHTCGQEPTDYSLDRFTGRVRRDSYPAVNNDGSQAVNRPYHFRRIACSDE